MKENWLSQFLLFGVNFFGKGYFLECDSVSGHLWWGVSQFLSLDLRLALAVGPWITPLFALLYCTSLLPPLQGAKVLPPIQVEF